MSKRQIGTLCGSLAILALYGTAAHALADTAKGRDYARQVCAECHAVEDDEAYSPNPDAPPFKVVANTPGWTGTALVVWLQSPHPTMPQLIVPDDVRNDLIDYILTLNDKQKAR